MIVLDAGVLIGCMFDQDTRHDAAVALLSGAAHELFGISPITLAEALVAPSRLGRVPAAEQMLRQIGVTEVPFPRGAAVQLADLRVHSGLRMPDCCVLLAALTAGATIATFDERLARSAAAYGIPTLTT